MDVGATICVPRAPRCLLCPLNRLCTARKQGLQEELPLRPARRAVPHHTVTAGVIWRRGRVLIAQRPPDKLLGGLWEFPGGKQEPGESLPECLARELREELDIAVDIGRPLIAIDHTYTHFSITLHVFVCRHRAGAPRALQVAGWKWVTPAELAGYALSRADRRVADLVARGEAGP